MLSDALWAAWAASALAVVVASHLHPPRVARFSMLVRRIEVNRVGYVAVLVGWMWLGWHFFAR